MHRMRDRWMSSTWSLRRLPNQRPFLRASSPPAEMMPDRESRDKISSALTRRDNVESRDIIRVVYPEDLEL